jgi:hypothetical protein
VGRKAVIFEPIGEGFEDVLGTVLGHPPKKKDDKKEGEEKGGKGKKKGPTHGKNES